METTDFLDDLGDRVIREIKMTTEQGDMKRLQQTLCTKTDSFSYTVVGESEPRYRVDSSGYLTDEKSRVIGKFCLYGQRWELLLNGQPNMQGPENSLFGLPEFELKALTALINKA